MVIETKKKRISRVTPVAEKLKQEGQLILGSITSLEEEGSSHHIQKAGRRGERREGGREKRKSGRSEEGREKKRQRQNI